MKTKKTLLALLLAVVLAVGIVAAWLLTRRTPNTEAVRIEVTGTQVDSPFRFPAAQRMAGRRLLCTGSYLVQPRSLQWQLLRQMRRGQQTPVRLTLTKYRTPGQLNAHLDTLLACSPAVDIADFYLFRPDTYEVYWTISTENLLARMRREWRKERESLGLHGDTVEIRGVRLGDEELVVLASIVEEETNYGPEKPLIAAVYLNRLRRGMPLQADPTVKYAVGDFTLQRILNRHLATESPYNTYLHTGLPPHPICTPSRQSLRAVVEAADSRDLYFCASDALDGTHRFAATLAEHNRNARRFHHALDARGIR